MTLRFDEGDELRAVRAAVADLGSRYGQACFLEQARSGGRRDALRAEAGKARRRPWASRSPSPTAAPIPLSFVAQHDLRLPRSY